MGKHPEKLPLQNRPIQLVSSYGDEPRRPINSLMLSLGNNLPGKAKHSCECDVWCVCVCAGMGMGVAFTSV